MDMPGGCDAQVGASVRRGGRTHGRVRRWSRASSAVSIFPFLSDYLRAWQMDLAKDAYEELRTFFRLFDPRAGSGRLRAARLWDIQHLAPRIRSEVLWPIGLMDQICPPSSQFAAYNENHHLAQAHGHLPDSATRPARA